MQLWHGNTFISLRNVYLKGTRDVRCPPATGLALKPTDRPVVVSYQSEKGASLRPLEMNFFTEPMNRSRAVVSVMMAAVQISQSTWRRIRRYKHPQLKARTRLGIRVPIKS
jgi:hypothetical protein